MFDVFFRLNLISERPETSLVSTQCEPAFVPREYLGRQDSDAGVDPRSFIRPRNTNEAILLVEARGCRRGAGGDGGTPRLLSRRTDRDVWRYTVETGEWTASGTSRTLMETLQ